MTAPDWADRKAATMLGYLARLVTPEGRQHELAFMLRDLRRKALEEATREAYAWLCDVACNSGLPDDTLGGRIRALADKEPSDATVQRD